MTGRGHPANQERQLALLTGEPHYEGKRCRACNGTARYTQSGTCVACAKAASAKTQKSKTKERQRSRRRREAAIDADLADLFGETSTEGERARGLHEGSKTSEPEHDSENAEETTLSTPCTPRIPHGSHKDIPGDTGISTGTHVWGEKGKSANLGVLMEDSAAEPMASADTEVGKTEYIKIRYFCHPESSSIFKTAGADPGSDGLVEEISAESYADLKAAGFTEENRTVYDNDDLDDILG